MFVFNFNIKKNIKEKNLFKNGTILLLGEFELFHKGHERLLKKANELKKNNEKIGILLIEKKDKKPIQNINNRIYNLAKLNFDFVILAEFSFEFKNIEGDKFINYLDINFNVKHYVVGEDFKFGKGASFVASDIRKISNSGVDIIDILKVNNIKISSTNIKQMHEFGEYNSIKNLLVNNLIFDIEIINNKIEWKENIIKPHSGIYFFKILIDKFWYHGIIKFSMEGFIDYYLTNFKNENIINQKSKIEIIDILRIIINSRYNNITHEDKEKTNKYFSI